MAGIKPTRAQAMADAVNASSIEANIKQQQSGKGYAIRELISSAQEKLQNAEDLVSKTEGVIDSTKVTKKMVSDLLAPAQAIVSLLDAVADVHPAIKVVAVIVKGVIQLELARHENDKQIAVVYFTMSSLLFLLGDLDPLFGDEQELHQRLHIRLDAVGDTVKDFAKLLRSSGYKEKLSGYASDFADHKKELHVLLTSQSSLKVADIQVDVKKIVAFIDAKTAKEQKVDELIEGMGGLDAALKSDKNLDELAKKLGEKMDTSTRRAVRADIDEALKANVLMFELKLDRISQHIQESVEGSTKTILLKLDEGPHMYIEDPDVQSIWKEMGSRLSAKTRVFLDAVHSYFSRKFIQHELDTGSPHPDVWTLHFLSKIIFYPSIGDGIDEDSSGFVSVHEVNSFLKSRPKGLNWSVAQWIAFWAAAPYKTDVEHQSKIESMVSSLESLAEDVLSQNQKRVKYFCGITKKLNLISVYDNILAFYGESDENDGTYEALEKLRVAWRNLELKRIKANLEKTRYRLKGVEAVAIITDGRRVEQSIMCLIYLLLHHHMKIVKLATVQTVSVAEFEDMRETWEYLFDAFDQRLDTLLEVWRQQRLDTSTQVECYAGGLFKRWHEKNQADEDESDSEEDDESDYDYSSGSEEDEEDGDEDQEGDETGSVDHGRELASVLSSPTKGKGETIPENLLLYPVPTEPEDEDGLSTDDESDWESPAIRRKKADAEMRKRVENIEEKMSVVEDLLRQLLAIQGHGDIKQSQDDQVDNGEHPASSTAACNLKKDLVDHDGDDEDEQNEDDGDERNEDDEDERNEDDGEDDGEDDEDEDEGCSDNEESDY
ncbi:hypothetical protein PHLCEN_2v637 [Hermanssonia centrifuga]|uniref:EF-hand domain-containing protein n=1 Tax=Hermanssonia centrifuga TaxID=98765 RepID=A0A2R6S5J6_9APHY|nr:hypothetical protein PHLCEN_2v637 [Hermanssonia centrifuga]